METTKGKTVVVFDFDWSLVNENTDTYIFDVLAPELIPELNLLRQEVQWTKLMNLMARRMMTEIGVTKQMLSACLRGIPYFSEMFAAARYAKDNGAALFIISDSNHFYITEILHEHQMEDIWEDLDNGQCHSCSTCPKNMCKGAIMQTSLDTLAMDGFTIDKIIYVGDGGGDYCPCRRLNDGDIICCREGWQLHKKLATARNADVASVPATIIPWSTGKEVLDAFVLNIS